MSKRVKNNRASKGRRFAIGDIHGCFNTFESLVEDKIALRKKDQLFLLGDYINKGPRNREVLDYILELQDSGFQIFPLIGNHEYFILKDVEFCNKSNGKSKIKDLIESEDLLDLNYNVESRYFNFFQNLLYYYELDNFILVHAGLDFELENPLTDKLSMIYARGYEVDHSKVDGKTIIHGHTPVDFAEINNQIKNHKKLGRINLDNGCVYKLVGTNKEHDLGRLCALNLDSMELVYCENID